MFTILYINLDRSESRRQKIENQLQAFDEIKYERISAVDGSKQGEIESVMKIPITNTTKNGNALGCTASHLKAIKHAYESKLNEVIILEDDVDITILKKTIHKFKELWGFMKFHTEILQFHTHGSTVVPGLYKPNMKNNYFDFITKTKHNMNLGLWGTTGYIINRIGMEKIMKLYDEQHNLFTFDNYKQYKPIADLILYIICTTKVVNVPFINTTDPGIHESTIQTKQHVEMNQLSTHMFIRQYESKIIKSIMAKKCLPANFLH